MDDNRLVGACCIYYQWINKIVFNRLRVFQFSRKSFLLFLLLMIPLFVLYALEFPYSSFKTTREVLKPCKLHRLDPWDETVKPYMVKLPDIQCADRPVRMYVNESGYLMYKRTLKDQIPALTCVYQKATRDGDTAVTFGREHSIQLPVFVNCRTFRVICRDRTGHVRYDFIHANVAASDPDRRTHQVRGEGDDQLSIIYLGLDSSSRSHFIRVLPKTYDLLTNTLGAYDFKGYMKVGENSFPNIVPLLTGQSSTWRLSTDILHTYIDHFPFLWSDPKMADYATLQSEDRPDISTFNYLKGGFKNPPVDYYFRPFSLAMSQIEPIIETPLGPSTWFCYGNRNHFHIQLEYLKHFVIKYTGKKKFAFLWNNQMGHEDFRSLNRADKPVFEFIRWLQDGGHLNRSVLIVGSDHGYRQGGFSNTYVGRLENNMPFLSIFIPANLKNKYKWIHGNLLRNTEQLVSPYDVHATMRDIVNANYADDFPKPLSDSQTSRSLFGRVPNNRSCLDAGIPAQFCMCDDMTSLDTSLPSVNKLGQFAVNHINSYFSKHRESCSLLTLQNITDAKAAFSTDGDSESKSVREHQEGFFRRFFTNPSDAISGRYVLMITTRPSMAMFEVMVDCELEPNDVTMTVVGEPIRVNKYGNQSHCVAESFLKPYCYCMKKPIT